MIYVAFSVLLPSNTDSFTTHSRLVTDSFSTHSRHITFSPFAFSPFSLTKKFSDFSCIIEKKAVTLHPEI